MLTQYVSENCDVKMQHLAKLETHQRLYSMVKCVCGGGVLIRAEQEVHKDGSRKLKKTQCLQTAVNRKVLCENSSVILYIPKQICHKLHKLSLFFPHRFINLFIVAI